ncbi:MAG: ABC transporter ATP-binding protein, partial [Lachnospiraceae bacterium]|nr:ABC transporter ATP-binding protein [Lachnospiraceae bacterium]
MPGPMSGRMPGEKKVENPGRIFKRLMKYVMKSYGLHLVIVAVLILVSVLANVQGTMFIQSLIDDYIQPLLTAEPADYQPLAMAILRVAGFYAIGVASAYIYNRLMINVTQGVLRNLRNDLFSHMETLPIKYFDTHSHGDIMSIYTNDTDTIRQMVSQSMPQVFNSAITVVSVFISMVILSVPLTIVTLVMVAVMLVVTARTAGISGRYFLQQQRDIGKVNGFIEEMMEGQKVVKVFCHEEENIQKFNELNENLYHSADRANYLVNIVGPVNMQLGNVSYVVCAIVGGALSLSGITGLSLGSLASFLTFNRSFNMPINQISQQLNSIVMAMAGAERIFKMLDEEPETDNGYVTLVHVKEENGRLVESKSRTGRWAWRHEHQADHSVDYVEVKGDVVFDGVDFGYNDEKIVLHDVQLFATPGQKIAFVGSTGAGKTTITNLINRFYDIQDGKIRYDGINVNKIRKADLRRSLGIVLQDTHLFTGTVMDNIRYGKLDATDEEVIAAAKLANADGFIRHLPEGYDTVLTGDGANLSQGQRQLLAIARAAIADPPVLILDEATSSIDTRTERIVQDGMDKLMKGRTTFV